MTDFVNKFTGEVLPYKSISSVEPDKGVENKGKDLCRLEDFEPISACVDRYLRTVDYNEILAKEYQFDSKHKPTSVDDDLLDIDSEADVLDQQLDLENYLESTAANRASDSAGRDAEVVSEERAQQSDEGAAEAETTKPSEE